MQMIRGLISGLRRIARTLRVRQIIWNFRWRVLNKISKRYQCYICGHRFMKFEPLWRSPKSTPWFMREVGIIGSDPVNYGCPFCYSNDRERHLFLYFDRLNLWQSLQGASVLHFAPEEKLSERIKACEPQRYFMVDLYPKNPEIQRVNIMDIPYASGSFDFVICNHVIEHVTDDLRALAEIYRVMKPRGRAVLQTPYSSTLARTIEDPGISTDQLRRIVYGQEDHVRAYGMDFFERLQAAGLRLKICRHDSVATASEARYYGMNLNEDLILVEKSQQDSEAKSP